MHAIEWAAVVLATAVALAFALARPREGRWLALALVALAGAHLARLIDPQANVAAAVALPVPWLLAAAISARAHLVPLVACAAASGAALAAVAMHPAAPPLLALHALLAGGVVAAGSVLFLTFRPAGPRQHVADRWWSWAVLAGVGGELVGFVTPWILVGASATLLYCGFLVEGLLRVRLGTSHDLGVRSLPPIVCAATALVAAGVVGSYAEHLGASRAWALPLAAQAALASVFPGWALGRLAKDQATCTRRVRDDLIKYRVHDPPAGSAADEPLEGVVAERVLGRGAQGVVSLVREVRTGRRLVLKEFLDHGSEGAARTRFLAELRALERIRHPNVVRLVGASVSKDRYFILTRHEEGIALSRHFEDGPMPRALVRDLAAQVASALGAAHEAGILHRDLKPDNILVTTSGRAVLLDFGAAGEAGARSGTIDGLDPSAGIVGSLQYLAPEVARGAPASTASDLYALGLVLFEALTGRPALPIAGLPFYEALHRVAAAEVDLEAVPLEWLPLLTRALARDPRDRHSTARELMSDLPPANSREGAGDPQSAQRARARA